MSNAPQTNGGPKTGSPAQVRVQTFADFMKPREKAFASAVPKGVDSEKLFRVALAAYSRTPDLWDCEIGSVYNAIQQAGALGLEVLSPLGHAYLRPGYNSKTQQREATLMIGYRGLMEIAYRSGTVASIIAEPVYDADDFEWERNEAGDKLRHKPNLSALDLGKIKAAYCRVTLVAGGTVLRVLSARDIEKRRKVAGDRSDMWRDWPEEGARKSAVKAAMKYLRLRPDDLEKLNAIEGDDAGDVDFAALATDAPEAKVNQAPQNDPGTALATTGSQAQGAAGQQSGQQSLPQGAGSSSPATEAAKEAMKTAGKR